MKLNLKKKKKNLDINYSIKKRTALKSGYFHQRRRKPRHQMKCQDGEFRTSRSELQVERRSLPERSLRVGTCRLTLHGLVLKSVFKIFTTSLKPATSCLVGKVFL